MKAPRLGRAGKPTAQAIGASFWLGGSQRQLEKLKARNSTTSGARFSNVRANGNSVAECWPLTLHAIVCYGTFICRQQKLGLDVLRGDRAIAVEPTGKERSTTQKLRMLDLGSMLALTAAVYSAAADRARLRSRRRSLQ
jgi:hypothetical protein